MFRLPSNHWQRQAGWGGVGGAGTAACSDGNGKAGRFVCASLTACEGIGWGDPGSPGELRLPCDRGSVGWEGTSVLLLTQRQPSACVRLRARVLGEGSAAERPQTPSAPAACAGPGSRPPSWAGRGQLTPRAVVDHCCPSWARSVARFGQLLIWEATPHPQGLQ